MSDPASDPSSDTVDVLYRHALAAYDQNDLAAAVPLFEQVLAVSPAHVEARYKLGNACKEQGHWDAAMAHYREVLRLSPRHAEAMNNLGAVCQMRGSSGEAEDWYRQALRARPALTQPHVNLGRLLQSAGRHAEARDVYDAALAQGGDAGLFGHLRDAATTTPSDTASARAPEAYVRETFDAFAGDFDRHLQDDLGYRVPAQLVELLHRHSADCAGAAMDVLDLGCGTGLVGDALGSTARSLVGVDLSGRMLEAARRKGRYAALHQADITAWLAAAGTGTADCVIAADVFIYLGELEAIFREVQRCLRPGGVFAFSVESCEGDGYRLLSSGRYAQSPAYVERLGAHGGFGLLAREAVFIRQGVEGLLYLFQRR